MSRHPIRIGLFAASPVYYQVPLYRRIAADPRFDFTAIFSSTAGVRPAKHGFTEPVAWDVDALSGYRSVFLKRADRTELDSASLLRHRDVDIVPQLLRGDFEVLWLHGYSSITHLLAIATQFVRRRPFLIRDDQTLLHPRPLHKRILKSVVLGAILRRAGVLYVGSANRRWFDSYGVSPSQQFAVPWCVDNAYFRGEAARLSADTANLRREFGIPEHSAPVILCVARLIPKKQPLFLLEAFRHVRTKHDCCLLLVGSGELEDEIRRQVIRRRIPDVILAGFRNQSAIARAYAVADVFVLPSKVHETWGLVVNEAMNFDLPIIVSDKVGCADDLVYEGMNGFVVSANDPLDLSARLEALVEAPELRRRFGLASREIVSQFTYESAAEGVVRAIAAAVGPARWGAAGAPVGERSAAPARGVV